ncbi:hypothetical protein HDU67_004768 [Dinochytrium kinnereticum]|nr:hypothetical protein HDU67_004768 [Dinochytrium kinnereticum]
MVILTPSNSFYPADSSISCYCTSNMLPANDQFKFSNCEVPCIDGNACGRVQRGMEPLVGSVYLVDRQEDIAPQAVPSSPAASSPPVSSTSDPQTSNASTAANPLPTSATDASPPAETQVTSAQAEITVQTPSEASTIRDVVGTSGDILGTLIAVPTAPLTSVAGPGEVDPGGENGQSAAPTATNGPGGSTGSANGNGGDGNGARRNRYASMYPGPNPTSTAVLSAVAISIFIFLIAMGFVTFFRAFTSCGRNRKNASKRFSSSTSSTSATTASRSAFSHSLATPSSPSVAASFQAGRTSTSLGRYRSQSAGTINSTTVLTFAAAEMPYGSSSSPRGYAGAGVPLTSRSLSTEKPLKVWLPPPPVPVTVVGLDVGYDEDGPPLGSSIMSPASPISSALIGGEFGGGGGGGVGGKRVRIVDPRRGEGEIGP